MDDFRVSRTEVEKLYIACEHFNVTLFDSKIDMKSIFVTFSRVTKNYLAYYAHEAWWNIESGKWIGELGVNANVLNDELCDPVDFYGSIIHELIHALECQRVTHSVMTHTPYFIKTAESIGLEVLDEMGKPTNKPGFLRGTRVIPYSKADHAIASLDPDIIIGVHSKDVQLPSDFNQERCRQRGGGSGREPNEEMKKEMYMNMFQEVQELIDQTKEGKKYQKIMSRMKELLEDQMKYDREQQHKMEYEGFVYKCVECGLVVRASKKARIMCAECGDLMLGGS